MWVLIFALISIVVILIQLINILNRSSNIRKNKSDSESIDYYRDCINYSPMIHAALEGKNITDSDVIVAMLLYLEEKKIISDENNKILLKNQNDLLEHEKFFAEKIKFILSDLDKNNKATYTNNYTLEQYLKKLVYDDLINEKIIDVNNDKNIISSKLKNDRSIIWKDNLTTLYTIFSYVYMIIFLLNDNFLIISKIFGVTILISLLLMFINKKKNYSFEILKTKKGNDLNNELNAQKKFLKDFSIISQRTIKEKELWVVYIRMAIFFDLKGILDKDSFEYYQNVISKYNYKEIKQSKKMSSIIMFLGFLAPLLLFSFLIPDIKIRIVGILMVIVLPTIIYLTNKFNSFNN